MKLFPDEEQKRRFMKTGLPVIFGIAWAPIITMVVMALLGPALIALTGSLALMLGVIFIITMLVTSLLLWFFMRIGRKFHSEKQ